jgi:O-succinylhomoserine sulfhydrylase
MGAVKKPGDAVRPHGPSLRKCTETGRSSWKGSLPSTRVKYPFLPSHPQYELARRQMKQGGGVLVFELSGGFDAACRFIDRLEMLSISSNLGDTRTIVTHPASTTHSKLTEEERLAVGITPGLVRISAGLEHIEDIISDVAQSLQQL